MAEAEWLTYEGPSEMLARLGRRVSERKLLLYGRGVEKGSVRVDGCFVFAVLVALFALVGFAAGATAEHVRRRARTRPVPRGFDVLPPKGRGRGGAGER